MNAGSFGTPSKTGTTDIRGTETRVIRFTWERSTGSFYVFLDGALEIAVTGNGLLNGSNTRDGVARFYYNRAAQRNRRV